MKLSYENWDAVELSANQIEELIGAIIEKRSHSMLTGDTLVSRHGSSFYICKVLKVARVEDPGIKMSLEYEEDPFYET